MQKKVLCIQVQKMANPLLQAIEELKIEEDLKKKPVLSIPKEKRLSYHSGWGKGKKTSDKVERQEKLG